jgi:hypothetical protein
VPDAAAPTARNLVAVPMMNKSQADVVYGFAGIRRSNPDYTAFSVMNNALGQYAIGGRLGDNIRERQGMAYYVSSSLDATFGPGPFAIRAGVAAANVEKTIASIDAELTAVLEQGFTQQEIDESKSYMIGAIPRQLETNAAIASFLLTVDTFDLGLDYDERLPGLIGAITKDAADAAGEEAARSPRAPRSRSPVRGLRLRPRAPRLRRDRLLIRAVFFDVDFTLIYPGPTFKAEGYRRACACTASKSTPRSSTPADRRVVVHPRRGRGADLHARRLRPLHRRRSSRRWAAAAPTSSTWRARSTTSGR